ncbi:MAG: hypothetical protein Gaeavirus8_12 [Gaeavirus sp.]|uniref:Uncharacterized protein n=1 Tax=Gaeavirus sp. TaxID=2487767 RepID=A0A3G5A1L1_9VIRU|nr:MAG: hypothetical protein Gaeavirus8_12 [Gaeavirus sp.]
MINKILLLALIAIVVVYLMNRSVFEGFRDSPPEAPPYVERKIMPSTQKIYMAGNLTNKDREEQLKETLKNKTLENKVLNYNQILVDATSDLTYYENDVINQSKILENAYDIINQVDLVDYGDVTTGMAKCKQNCNGVCLELGYTGSATCFPEAPSFDYGTLYKNPTFTYGIDQHRYEKI